ncbi:hypothetical protein ACFY3J_11095 [Streptomyces sp. NPDC001231]|uniref:hypothetical protein n=1 Tax=Streptomyces sp. NPDC001231 TaxID=3364549 RepID=UPI0036B22FEC
MCEAEGDEGDEDDEDDEGDEDDRDDKGVPPEGLRGGRAPWGGAVWLRRAAAGSADRFPSGRRRSVRGGGQEGGF